MSTYVFKADLSTRQAVLQLPEVKAARNKLAAMLRDARRTEPKVAKVLWRRLQKTNARMIEAMSSEIMQRGTEQ